MPLDLVAPFLDACPVFRREALLAFVADHLSKADPELDPKTFTRSVLGYAMKKKLILSIRNGYYCVVGPQARTIDPMLIAGLASRDAVIGFQAALHWHLKRKIPPRIHVYSSTIQDFWEFEGRTYVPVRANLGPGENESEAQGVEGHGQGTSKIRITTLERTLVDVLDRQDLATDFLADWKLLPRLAFCSSKFCLNKVVEYLERLGCTTTTAKVGYFLSGHLEAFQITQKDLNALPEMPCLPHPWGKRSDIVNGQLKLPWNLFIPESLSLPNPEPQQLPTDHEGRLKPGICLDNLDLGNELRKRFGRFRIKRFRDGQEKIVRAVLTGRNAIAILPTGAGKSLTYQFPATFLSGVTLVFSPLISLMQDQVLEARAKHLTAFAIRSSKYQKGKKCNRKQLMDKTGSCRPSRSTKIDWSNYREIAKHLDSKTLDLLFLAPESLNRTLKMLPQLKQLVVQMVVDEAHVIHEWGEDFRPEYKELGRIRHLFPDVPVLALTATATDLTRGKIIQALELKDFEETKFSVFRSSLYLERRHVDGGCKEKLKVLLEFLSRHPDQSGIVYCQTKPETERIARQLQKESIKARHYHAGMTSAARQATQNAFMQNRCQLVVATIAFGMGINKRDVRFVVHMGLPRSLLGYVQEIGRGGRDGKRADCLLIHSEQDDLPHLRRIRKRWWLLRREEALSDQDCSVSKRERLRARETELEWVRAFASTSECLNKFIADHFQEPKPDCNRGCEICLGRDYSPPSEDPDSWPEEGDFYADLSAAWNEDDYPWASDQYDVEDLEKFESNSFPS